MSGARQIPAAPLVLILLGLAACQSPVSNPRTVSSSGSGLPFGSGHTVYAADAAGSGVLVYANGAKNWTELDWSSLYAGDYSAGRSLAFPPVNDVAVSGSTVYAATEDGLIVGSGTNWTKYLPGTQVYGVTLDTPHGNLYVASQSGLYYSPLSSFSLSSAYAVDSNSDKTVLQIAIAGSAAFAATPYGIYKSAVSPYTSYSSPTSSSYTPYAGAVNTVAGSGSTLYAGMASGLAVSGDSGATWSNLTTTNGLGGAVNGILIGGSQVYLGTAGGFSYGTGSSWSNVVFGTPVYNVVQGLTASTLYVAAGYSGLMVIPLDSGGNPEDTSDWSEVFSGEGLNVVKVFVTVP